MSLKKWTIGLLLLWMSNAGATTLLQEGFEGTFPPSGWQNVAVNGSYTWQQHQGTYHPDGYNAHGGTYVAMFNSYSASSGNSARLITDTVDLSSYTNGTLTFWMFHDDEYSDADDSIVVEIKKRSGGSWPSDWTKLATFRRYNASGDGWQEHQVDLSSYVGDSIIIAFHAISAYGNDLHIDDVSIDAPAENDVGVTGIIPPELPRLNESRNVGFVVKNFGAQAQSNFYVVFQGKSNSTKDSVLVSSLASGDVDTVYKTYTPSGSGEDSLTAWTNLSNDENRSNDTSKTAFYVLGQTEFLYSGFEYGFPPHDWQNEAVSGSYTWEWVTSTSYPSGYSPHDGTYMARYDSYHASSGSEARLITDTIDLSSTSMAYIEFWMFHDNGLSDKPDSVIVEIKVRSGKGWPTDWTRLEGFARYNSTTGWQKHTIGIGSYTGDSVVIAFRAKSGYGNDLYIDDIKVYKPADNDLGVTGILAKAHYRQGESDTLWFVVKNFGAQAQSNFYVVFQGKKNSTKDSVQVASLSAGAVDTVYKVWTPDSGGTDTITAWTNLSNDQVHANDSSTAAVTIWYGNIHIIESFEYGFLPGGWSMDSSGSGIHWASAHKTQSPYGYDPPDGDSLVYLGTHGFVAGVWCRLITDTIDMTTDSAATVRFQMFHDDEFPDQNDFIVVEVKKRTGGSWPTEWTPVDTFFRYRSTDHWEEHTVDISDYTGDSVIVAFKGVGQGGRDLHIDKIEIFQNPEKDLGIFEVISGVYHQNEQDSIGVAVKNYGSRTQTDIWVYLEIKSAKAVDSLKINSLPVGQIDTVYFQWTPSNIGYDSVITWTAFPGDTITSNDTVKTVVQVYQQGVILQESFEMSWLPEGWETDSGRWSRVTHSSSPSGYNPHSGTYMAMFLGSDYGETSRLITKEVDLTEDSLAVLEFWLLQSGYYIYPDSLIIEVRKLTETGWRRLRGIPRYSRYTGWRRFIIPLSDYAGEKIRIAFKGFYATGRPIFIDDIKVYTQPSVDVAIYDFLEKPFYLQNRGDTLKFVIANLGSQMASNFYIYYSFQKSNAKGGTGSVHIDSILAGNVDTVSVLWTPSASYYDTLTIWTSVNGDTVHFNDTLIVYDMNLLPQIQRVREDFERPDHGFPPFGWYRSDEDWGPYASGTQVIMKLPGTTTNDTLMTYYFDLPSNFRLRFDFRQSPDVDNVMKIYAGNSEVATITDGSYKGRWRKAYYNLTTFASDSVDIKWVCERAAGNAGTPFYMDNVYVEETPNYDPAIAYVTSPVSSDTVQAGATVTFKGRFDNYGRNTVSFKAKVEVQEATSGKGAKWDPLFVDSTTATLSPWDTTLITFPNTWTTREWNYYNALGVYPVLMSVSYDGDGDFSNNEAEDTVVVIAHEVHIADTLQWLLKDTLRGAQFNWVDLTTMNTDSVDTFALGDEGGVWIKLGRKIRINGNVYDSVYVSSNGAIEFAENSVTPNNSHLYTSSQSVFFAVFWEDLQLATDLSSAPNNLLYTRVWADSTVIEWYNVRRYGGTETFTFEVIIYTPDGGHANIKYQYYGMSSYVQNEMDATIGFQIDYHAVDAAEYTYNEEPFVPNWDRWAILCQNPELSPASKDVGISSISELVSPHVNDTDTIKVTVKNFGTDSAYDFWVYLKIGSFYLDSARITDTLSPGAKSDSVFVDFQVVWPDTEGGNIYQPMAWTGYGDDVLNENDTMIGDPMYLFGGGYGESFESFGFPYPGYAYIDYAGGGHWQHSTGGFDGSYCMELYNDPYATLPQYGGYDDWLILPGVIPNAADTDFVNFVAKLAQGESAQLDVMVDTTSNTSIDLKNYHVDTTVTIDDDWRLYKIRTFSRYSGKDVKVALRYRTAYNQNGYRVVIDCIDKSRDADKVGPIIWSKKMPHSHYYGSEINPSDTVRVKVTDRSGVKSVKLKYRTRTGGGNWGDWTEVTMTKVSGTQNEYQGTIPSPYAGTEVQYYIEATDSSDNTSSSDTLKYNIEHAEKWKSVTITTEGGKEGMFSTMSSPGSGISIGLDAIFRAAAQETPLTPGQKDFVMSFALAMIHRELDSLPNHQKLIVALYLKAAEMNYQNDSLKAASNYAYKAIKAFMKFRYGEDYEKGYSRRKTVILSSMDFAENFKDTTLFTETWHVKFIKSDLSESQDIADTLQGISGDPITDGMPNIIVEYTESPDMLVPWGYECVTASGDTVVVDSGWRFMTVKNGDSTNTAGGIAYRGVTHNIYIIPFPFRMFKDSTLIDTLLNRIEAFDSTAAPPNVIDWCGIATPHRDTITPGDSTDWLYVDVFEDGLTNAKTDNRDSIVVEVGFGPKNTVPWLNSNWQWFRTYFDTTVDSMYRYKGRIPTPGNIEPGHYDFAFRISVRDSGRYGPFYYADTVGHPDSAETYTYDTTKAGDLWVAYQNDVASDSLANFSEGDTVNGGSSKTPRVFLANKGRNPASFQAICYIINTTTGDTVYGDTLNYSNIPSDTSFWADFDTWNAPSFLRNRPLADFRIVTFVKLTGDDHTANDTITTNFKLIAHEIHDNSGWVSKDLSGGASYNWVELVSTKVDSVDTLAPGDDGGAWVRLGRRTVIYGDTLDSVYVGSNGAVKFVASNISYSNSELPVDGPVLVAPFWEDLYVKSGVTGGLDSLIYVRKWQDSTVIEWYRVPRYGTDRLFTFEVIFYTPPPPGHGNIKFQYKDMSAYDPDNDNATIGMQDSSSNKATSNYILYTYDENPFSPNWSDGKFGKVMRSRVGVRTDIADGGVLMGGAPKSGQAILFVNPQPTGVEEQDSLKLPSVLTLYPNMPNPFRRFTVIQYAVPERMEVELAVYDIAGRRVAVLASGMHNPGIYRVEWKGTDNRGSRLPAGVYFYRLHTERRTIVKKLVLIK